MSTIINATTTNGVVIQPDNSGSLQLATNNGTTAVTISTAQNVGIGTSSFAFANRVVVKQSADNSAAGLGARIERNANDSSLFLGYRDNSDSWQVNASYSSTGAFKPITFHTSDTEAMRIDSSGNVLVGTTSNASSAAKIMVSSASPQMAVDGNGAGVNSLINWTTSGTTKAQTFFDATNTRFYIACNNSGGVYLASGGTSWTAVSDERVKDIIEPITDAANKVSTLRAVIGKYKTDAEDTRRSFLIAQDIQAVLPEAVDATNPENLGVQYTDVIPLLVAAIKEQQTIINDLKARIETLEAK